MGNLQKLSCCHRDVGMYLKGESFSTNGSLLKVYIKLALVIAHFHFPLTLFCGKQTSPK